MTQLLKQVPYGPPGCPSFPFPTLTVSEIKTLSWLSAQPQGGAASLLLGTELVWNTHQKAGWTVPVLLGEGAWGST